HAVIDKANIDKYDDAVKAANAAEKRWPALPGILAARCDLEFRLRKLAAARQHCTQAIAHAQSSWALYLLGVLELQNTSRAASAAGIARLRQAIDIDPDLTHAWRMLGKALLRIDAMAERDQLRRDYYTRFHTTM